MYLKNQPSKGKYRIGNSEIILPWKSLFDLF